MTTVELMYRLKQIIMKYGDIEIDLVQETPDLQIENPLHDLAVSISSNKSRPARLKLLDKNV